MEDLDKIGNITDEVLNCLTRIDNTNTNLRFGSIEEYDTHYVISFYGGLNGRGQFLFYLEDVASLVKKLMCIFNNVWLVKWENDCPDDVFEIEIGVSYN